jgi:UDP-N-acetylmuramyl-tripeptide synthetase
MTVSPHAVPRRARLSRVLGRNLRLHRSGLAFDVSTPWGDTVINSGMIGRFNALNLLGVLGVLLASDVPLQQAAGSLSRMRPVPGRIERHGGGTRPLAVIDYAHTPDALAKVLDALREVMRETGSVRRARAAGSGRLICVFGCGGDRDPGKRPLMGRVASRLADRVVVTSDNPRNEDPAAIIADILKGAKNSIVEPDRERAIRVALRDAGPGDIVLVAGKGHESYQSVRGVNLPYSDTAVVQQALRELWP